MKVQRYVRQNPQRIVEDLIPSSILESEINDELKFYDDKLERLSETLAIVQRVLGALLDELPEEIVRNALRSSIYRMHVNENDPDDSDQ